MGNFKLNPNIKKIIKMALQEGLEDATDVLKDKVKSNAPEDTGNLKNNIKTEKVDELNVKVIADTEYAEVVEFGSFKSKANPYFRPAIRESAKKMLKQFRNKI